MIKAILFDLDGVLIDASSWHFIALNKALSLFGFEISQVDHQQIFNGLPTRKKLQILTEKFNFPVSLHDLIHTLKQNFTNQIVDEFCMVNQEKLRLIQKLKEDGFKIAVCSNCILKTVKQVLQKSKLINLCDIYLSNEDVTNSKPHPEMYLKAIAHLGINPDECVVLEDSDYGKQAAQASGAFVLEVNDMESVDYEFVQNFLRNLEKVSI